MLVVPKPMNPRVRRLWRFFWENRLARPRRLHTGPTKRVPNQKLEDQMGLLDKLLGRGKKAAGDLMGDASMRHEGAAQERQGAAEDRAAQHEEMAQEQRNQAAEARAERENT
jgi:uncharacterized protein YjbJ (UPF0337 family)